MADYISREAAKQILSRLLVKDAAECACNLIECVLPADVEPVRHGRWLDYMCRDWHCSECGEKISKVRNVDGYCYDDKPNYCFNCGAKMDLEDETNDD